ncbi:MAG: hypothetical protein GY839_20045 [candidate division Zixibacteria bacterium]|nr:hypothetical protein [candidate division Zixibacteria bacterium]
MSKLKELIRSGHIHVALALGISIIVLALFSKRVLAEPLSYLELSICGLLMLGYETVVQSKKTPRPGSPNRPIG